MKKTLCNELLDKGLVTEGDVIRHSYTRNRLDNGVENMGRTESKQKLSPTLDTRCDCLGVVVKEPTALQKEVGNQAIKKGLMKPYDIIDYTYSNSRLDEMKNGKIKTKNSENNQIANTLTTNAENMGVCVPNNFLSVSDEKVIVREATKKGYAEAVEGDSIDFGYPDSKTRRGRVGQGVAQTLTTTPQQSVVVKADAKINVIGNYSPSGHDASRIVHPDGLAPTVKENHGTVTATIAKCVGGVGEKKSNGGKQWFQQDRVYQGDIALAHPAQMPGGSYRYVVGEPSELRIRKLTPKECWRLMGFADEDFEKAEKVCSNSQLFKQAGNAIVVNVLMAIFKELFVPKQTRSEWLDELLG